ncbi:hypothetical protein LEP1GSC072_2332 [Leptospira noguchii str. Bonito]|nr:hypothetical protein LEP1GSC072_2332 [Leptospira noguchii str. Bonito]
MKTIVTYLFWKFGFQILFYFYQIIIFKFSTTIVTTSLRPK